MTNLTVDQPNDISPRSSRGDILVIDDSRENLRLLAEILSEQGYRVRMAINGKLGLHAAQLALPDLILLDIRLPEMDGFEVCAQLKAQPATQNIPIIFCSVLDKTNDFQRAFHVGGIDYISKPYMVPEVIARVEAHLTRLHAVEQHQTMEHSLRDMRALVFAVTLAEERERHRIAQMLQDEVGQSLTGALLQVKHLLTLNTDHAGSEMVERLHAILNNTLASTRSLISELSPPVLHELGLIPALRWQALRVKEQSGLLVTIHHDGHEKPLSSDATVMLYNMMSELLSNVVKHARANTVTLTCTVCDDSLCLEVVDDGVGFTPETQSVQGFGLLSIRERLRHAQGTCTIWSQPGHGTRVTISLPMTPPAETAEQLDCCVSNDSE